MRIEDRVREGLEHLEPDVEASDHTWQRIEERIDHHRAGPERRLALAVGILVAAIGLGVAGWGVIGGLAKSTSPEPGSVASSGGPQPSSPSVQDSTTVPDLAGYGEGDAVKVLGELGLVANIRRNNEAPRTGQVLWTVPRAQAMVPNYSVVTLTIALPPPLPTPQSGHEQDTHALGTLVEEHEDAFVGFYVDLDGVPVVVLGPGVNVTAWRERMDAAATGLYYRTSICGRSRGSLLQIQEKIARRDWSTNPRIGFGVNVDPASCTVRVESDLLTADDIHVLVQRYGTAVSFDTTPGSHPVPLPLTSSP
jgi:PASTA domain